MTPEGWKRQPFGPHGKGWVYRNRARRFLVMALSGEARRRWFIVCGPLGLSYAADKAGNVRLFGSPEGAMRAAEKLKRAA